MSKTTGQYDQYDDRNRTTILMFFIFVIDLCLFSILYFFMMVDDFQVHNNNVQQEPINDYAIAVKWISIWTLAFPTLLPSFDTINTLTTHNGCEILYNDHVNSRNNQYDSLETDSNNVQIPHNHSAIIAYHVLMGNIACQVLFQKYYYSEDRYSTVDSSRKYEKTTTSKNLTNTQNYSHHFDKLQQIISTTTTTSITHPPPQLENNLGYGEIQSSSIIFCISYIQYYHYTMNNGILFHGRKIVDLGSGNGNVLFAAVLAHAFQVVIGVEIIPFLHEEALDHLNTWNKEYDLTYGYLVKSDLHNCDKEVNCLSSDDIKERMKNPSRVEFMFFNQDFSACDPSLFHDSDVIIVHATLFDEELMNQVQEICEACAVGSYFVMVTKPLKWKTYFNVQRIFQGELDMDWGKGMVYIQQLKP